MMPSDFENSGYTISKNTQYYGGGSSSPSKPSTPTDPNDLWQKLKDEGRLYEMVTSNGEIGYVNSKGNYIRSDNQSREGIDSANLRSLKSVQREQDSKPVGFAQVGSDTKNVSQVGSNLYYKGQQIASDVQNYGVSNKQLEVTYTQNGKQYSYVGGNLQYIRSKEGDLYNATTQKAKFKGSDAFESLNEQNRGKFEQLFDVKVIDNAPRSNNGGKELASEFLGNVEGSYGGQLYKVENVGDNRYKLTWQGGKYSGNIKTESENYLSALIKSGKYSNAEVGSDEAGNIYINTKKVEVPATFEEVTPPSKGGNDLETGQSIDKKLEYKYNNPFTPALAPKQVETKVTPFTSVDTETLFRERAASGKGIWPSELYTMPNAPVSMPTREEWGKDTLGSVFKAGKGVSESAGIYLSGSWFYGMEKLGIKKGNPISDYGYIPYELTAQVGQIATTYPYYVFSLLGETTSAYSKGDKETVNRNIPSIAIYGTLTYGSSIAGGLGKALGVSKQFAPAASKLALVSKIAIPAGVGVLEYQQTGDWRKATAMAGAFMYSDVLASQRITPHEEVLVKYNVQKGGTSELISTTNPEGQLRLRSQFQSAAFTEKIYGDTYSWYQQGIHQPMAGEYINFKSYYGTSTPTSQMKGFSNYNAATQNYDKIMATNYVIGSGVMPKGTTSSIYDSSEWNTLPSTLKDTSLIKTKTVDKTYTPGFTQGLFGNKPSTEMVIKGKNEIEFVNWKPVEGSMMKDISYSAGQKARGAIQWTGNLLDVPGKMLSNIDFYGQTIIDKSVQGYETKQFMKEFAAMNAAAKAHPNQGYSVTGVSGGSYNMGEYSAPSYPIYDINIQAARSGVKGRTIYESTGDYNARISAPQTIVKTLTPISVIQESPLSFKAIMKTETKQRSTSQQIALPKMTFKLQAKQTVKSVEQPSMRIMERPTTKLTEKMDLKIVEQPTMKLTEKTNIRATQRIVEKPTMKLEMRVSQKLDQKLEQRIEQRVNERITTKSLQKVVLSPPIQNVKGTTKSIFSFPRYSRKPSRGGLRDIGLSMYSSARTQLATGKLRVTQPSAKYHKGLWGYESTGAPTLEELRGMKTRKFKNKGLGFINNKKFGGWKL
jgi:hypothetical protein